MGVGGAHESPLLRDHSWVRHWDRDLDRDDLDAYIVRRLNTPPPGKRTLGHVTEAPPTKRHERSFSVAAPERLARRAAVALAAAVCQDHALHRHNGH